MTDALVNQECLVVLHSGGIVRLYSLQHIITQVSAMIFVAYFRQLSNCSIYLCWEVVFLLYFYVFSTLIVKIMNQLLLWNFWRGHGKVGFSRLCYCKGIVMIASLWVSTKFWYTQRHYRYATPTLLTWSCMFDYIICNISHWRLVCACTG